MDDYERKLKELRTYVPFLTKMIDKLEKAGDKSKEAQLQKMKSLKQILTATDKKLRLGKCKNADENAKMALKIVVLLFRYAAKV